MDQADSIRQSNSLAISQTADIMPKPRLTRGMLWTFTIAAGVAVANLLYYKQPLLTDMQRSFHTTPRSIGLVSTFTQVG